MSPFRINNTTREIIIPIIAIPSIDLLLCFLFGVKARWFQLHSAINIVIVGIIFDDVVKLYRNPIYNNHDIDSKLELTYIMTLHIYHLLISKNITFMDYCHHLLFVGFACLPAYIFYNNNLLRLSVFATCGLTGSIEYFMLALVKHNRLTSIKQKMYNTYIYNYLRYPFSMYSVIAIYISSLYNPEIIGNYPMLLLFMNLTILLNGSFYNKLAIENYIEHKMKEPYHNDICNI